MKFEMQEGPEPMRKVIVVGIGEMGSHSTEKLIQQGKNSCGFLLLNSENRMETEELMPHSSLSIEFLAGDIAQEQLKQQLREYDLIVMLVDVTNDLSAKLVSMIGKEVKENGKLSLVFQLSPSSENSQYSEQQEPMTESLSDVDSFFVLENHQDQQSQRKPVFTTQIYKELEYTIQALSLALRERGQVHLDWNDLYDYFSKKGEGAIGTGQAHIAKELSLEQLADSLLEQVMQSIFMKHDDLRKARSIFVMITSTEDLTILFPFMLTEKIQKLVEPDASIMFGWEIDADANYKDTIQTAIFFMDIGE